jgi:sugar/nucleoside kinase (ribokinase family)
MKFLVLGHLCVDLFHRNETAEGDGAQEPKRWGGIFFSLATLANIDEAITVQPVFGVAEEEYERFQERIQRYRNVDPSGIYRIAGPANQVSLFYEGRDRKIECSDHIAPPIPFERIEPYLDATAILVNMISGFDLTLETLNRIRMRTQENGTLLHLDLHSLTLGIDEKHRRFYRPLETWRRWCYLADTVQMNEEESKVLTLEHLQENDLAKQILSLGLEAVVVARGSRGVTTWVQNQKSITRYDIPASPVENPVDPTGCGDVFAAAFCYHFAAHRDAHAAAEFANSIAALNVGYVGSDGIDAIGETRLSPPWRDFDGQARRGVEAAK